ncbi:type II toxin-antitoxin system RelE/ParE family toxin [Catellatospora coxensis]|uniref:type II toxin-antitoxin system RelE/ParE family toxin n=1 Tax=Catellatospora coxensis TaxID=310354 RepID=UPI001EF3407B|nr:type II toxin-antitoxin system RelE/ParE family toxin [Catellatospora coxensis]
MQRQPRDRHAGLDGTGARQTARRHAQRLLLANLKELRPRSGRDVSIRILFVFDPWFQAVLLVAGNKPELGGLVPASDYQG